MTALTTHVLDTASGKPAAGVNVTLFRLGQSKEFIGTAITNQDGRCDTPLLKGKDFEPGIFELEFAIGDYFDMPGIRFLDNVIIRFGISDASEHYHVPLLISPFGYSTYRGS